MLTIGSIAFAAPWMLAALLALPVIWWLLRLMPPVPKRERFPAIRFLLGLEAAEETPAHTPWWLLLLRLGLTALVIVALADPVLNPDPQSGTADTLVLVVDDGWPAAARWDRRQAAMAAAIDDAVRQNRSLALIGTAPTSTSQADEISLLAPADARGLAHTLSPKAWLPDRAAIVPRLQRLAETLARNDRKADVLWISDGLDYGQADDFAEALERLGLVTMLTDPPAHLAWALRPPQPEARGLSLTIVRPPAAATASGRVRVLGERRHVLGYGEFTFAPGAAQARTHLALPLDLRNQARRIEIEGQASAGAVVLLDERWRRHRVGLVTTGHSKEAQPLLSDLFYLDRALGPYADISQGSLGDVLKQDVSVLVLADVGRIVGDERAAVEEWVTSGGILVRFAGPRMASQSDDLIPVRLRQGGRALGGALSWEEPQKLSPFDDTSPFYGLTIPDDVTIARQILAQPTADLPQHTWARLSDGTPLVTAARRGRGRIVLFHVTASPEWSSLPMSGLYVEMLRRIVAMAADLTPTATPQEQTRSALLLRAVTVLDGTGTSVAAPASAMPITRTDLVTTRPSPAHPPGLYAAAGIQMALNTVGEDLALTRLGPLPGLRQQFFAERPARSLKPALLVIALALLLLDGVIALVLSGRVPIPRRAGIPKNACILISTGLLAASIAMPSPLFAQSGSPPSDDDFALRATTQTALAYVLTGDAAVDRMSHAGLTGLSRVLRARTAMEPAAPMGIDIERDELAFFPLIYWPVVSGQPTPSPAALAKIDAFMKNGGTILFDTQDHQTTLPGLPGRQSGNKTLQRLLASLDIPPLEPVPANHILTKAFYLLQDFPGRWSGGRLWVEARSVDGQSGAAISNDGVSPIIIGSNDYAAAWAEDSYGRPLAAVVPGGQRQREMAFRFGVNLVMYTLTGNYKADQVHVPALLERLGQ